MRADGASNVLSSAASTSRTDNPPLGRSDCSLTKVLVTYQVGRERSSDPAVRLRDGPVVRGARRGAEEELRDLDTEQDDHLRCVCVDTYGAVGESLEALVTLEQAVGEDPI